LAQQLAFDVEKDRPQRLIGYVLYRISGM